jgi:hypothetical protein
MGASIFAVLNHFPYLINSKMNIDIPVYKNIVNLTYHVLSIGVGIQHRNSIKLIGYIESDNYYGIYNSYYFIFSYRILI